MKTTFINLWRFLFLRRRCYRINRFIYGLSLRGMGLLNYDDNRMSGEEHLLERLCNLWNDKTTGQTRKPVILDVGANRGIYSKRIRELCPGADVHSFEPHPKTFAELQKLGQAYQFRTINAACGDAAGTLKLFDYSSGEGSEHASLYADVLRSTHHTNEVNSWDVQITTVDEYLQQMSIDKVDLLKIDTEGHELKVLMGAKKSLANNAIEMIHFEFNEMNVISRVFFRDFIEILPGYRLYRLLPDGIIPIVYTPIQCELFGFQNILALKEPRAHAIEEAINV